MPAPLTREMPYFARSCPRNRGVLVGDRGAKLREHARRQVKAGRDRVEMTGAGAGAGADEQLVVLAGGDDLVHERVEARAAAVDDALPADLDHRGVGQDLEIRRCVCRRQKLRVGQRSLHEERFELGRRVGHGVPFVVSNAVFYLSDESIVLPELLGNMRKIGYHLLQGKTTKSADFSPFSSAIGIGIAPNSTPQSTTVSRRAARVMPV